MLFISSKEDVEDEDEDVEFEGILLLLSQLWISLDEVFTAFRVRIKLLFTLLEDEAAAATCSSFLILLITFVIRNELESLFERGVVWQDELLLLLLLLLVQPLLIMLLLSIILVLFVITFKMIIKFIYINN